MHRLKAVCTLFIALGVTLSALAAWAGKTEDYQPYHGAEQVSAPLLVIIAYSAIWLLLLAFVVSVWRRQRQVAADLAQLESQLRQIAQKRQHDKVKR